MRHVGNRVIEQDLKLLRAVLNWGLKNGYLDRVPMAHESFPREASPKRPILYEDDFERMLAVAPDVHRLCPLALILGHETGHRIGAIGRLRWSDIDLEAGSIRWSKEGDKQDREHVVPVSDRALAALQQYDTGDRGWLFPSPVRPGQPIGREVFTKWWGQLEERAGLEHESGRGWHALRRTFATERKELPLADLAVAGGWTGIQTLTKCYIQPDEATVRKVVNHRKPLLRTAVEK
jgi:integrase